jgi:hypothetical protein
MSVVLKLHDTQKVRRCLDALQLAQSIVNQAAEHLCSVPGFANEWSSLSKPHDAVKAAWHRVDSRRIALAARARAAAAKGGAK